MRELFFSIFVLSICSIAMAQVDKEQLALDVSKADAANTELLKAMIWKRSSSATVDGSVKASVINEVSFDETGKIQVSQIDAQSNVKQKPGLRGRAQQSAAEDNMDYVEQALELAIAYTYMSKGQLLDFFEKSEVTEVGNTYQIVGADVLVTGDSLSVVVEKTNLLFMSKKFSSKLGEDPITGEITYDKFSSGTSHVTVTQMMLQAKNAVINAKNQDYSQRIN